MKRAGRPQNKAVALFLVITSLIIISLSMRELLVRSTAQVDRVRNAYARIQALYLARSNLNLARTYLTIFGSFAVADYDNLRDLPQLIPFPISAEVVQGLTGLANANEDGSKNNAPAPMPEELVKTCNKFNLDFAGESYALIDDLSARLNINMLSLAATASGPYRQVLTNLLAPNFKFIDELEGRGIERDALVSQIRDYIDNNTIDDSSNAPEEYPYQQLQLNYGPKNFSLALVDELKLVPAVDDFLFYYLKDKVNVLPVIRGQKESRINLNSVTAEVFQALLKSRGGNDDQLAKQFIKDRTENNRVYSRAKLDEKLSDAGFSPDSLYTEIIGTRSEAYLVTSRATVGDTEVALEATIRNPRAKSSPGSKSSSKPIIMMRVQP